MSQESLPANMARPFASIRSLLAGYRERDPNKTALVDLLTQTSCLVEHIGHKILTCEARVHRHQQHKVESRQKIVQNIDRRRRVERDASPDTLIL